MWAANLSLAPHHVPARVSASIGPLPSFPLFRASNRHKRMLVIRIIIKVLSEELFSVGIKKTAKGYAGWGGGSLPTVEYDAAMKRREGERP